MAARKLLMLNSDEILDKGVLGDADHESDIGF